MKLRQDFAERTPIGLTQVTALTRQARFDAAVQGSGHERLATVLDRGVHDESAVRCEAGAFVTVAVGDGSHVATGNVHDLELESTARARDVGQPATIWADRW